MNRTRLKNTFILILLIVVVTQAVFLLRKGASPASPPEAEKSAESPTDKAEEGSIILAPEAQKSAGLTLEEVQSGAVQNLIQVSGTVQPNDARVARIRLLSRGRVDKVSVRVGDHVRADQILLSYDNIELAEFVAELIKANDTIAKNKTQVNVLKRALERAESLVVMGALSEAEKERRKAEYENALASLNSSTAEAARAKQQLARFGIESSEDAKSTLSVLKAPFSGIVTSVKAADGELKNADEEVFTISDLSSVWVQGDVYERDLAKVRTGLSVSVTMDALPGRTFIGRVTYISDILDPTTRTAKVRCEVENPRGEMKIGMFVGIALPLSGSRVGITISEDAVQMIQKKSVVFVQEGDDHFEKREVELGARSGGRIEARSGVKAGEKIVTRGSFALKSQVLKSQIGGEENE